VHARTDPDNSLQPCGSMEAVQTAQFELSDASKAAAALGVIDVNAAGSGGWYACIEV
jgi:hypothetical protein